MHGRADSKKVVTGLLVAGLLATAATACAESVRRGRGESPAPASGASDAANDAADRGFNTPVAYRNAGKAGPAVVVLDGEIKSTNATFNQQVSANNIADYAELELGQARFKVLERSDLGALKREFRLAYNAGDVDAARRFLSKGKFKATRWVLRFDVLKAEPVAESSRTFNWRDLIHMAGGPSVDIETGGSANVWIIGMRYKVIDARTTEQVASGYFEEKMEAGRTVKHFAMYHAEDSGGLTLDSMVQRLVQDSVVEIDAKYK